MYILCQTTDHCCGNPDFCDEEELDYIRNALLIPSCMVQDKCINMTKTKECSAVYPKIGIQKEVTGRDGTGHGSNHHGRNSGHGRNFQCPHSPALSFPSTIGAQL